MTEIGKAVQIRQQIRERLIAQFPELAEDEDTLLGTLDGIDNLKEALVEMFEASEHDKLKAAAIDTRIEALEARKARFKHRVDTMRSTILWAMEEAAVHKIEGDSVTLSIRTGSPSVVIEDETKLPSRFITVKEVRAPDKKAIKEMLQAGTEVPGASLSNGHSVLNSRVK